MEEEEGDEVEKEEKEVVIEAEEKAEEKVEEAEVEEKVEVIGVGNKLLLWKILQQVNDNEIYYMNY